MTLHEETIYSYFDNGNSIATFKLLAYKLNTGDAILNIFPYIPINCIGNRKVIGWKLHSYMRSYTDDNDFKTIIGSTISLFTGKIVTCINDDNDDCMKIKVPDMDITIVISPSVESDSAAVINVIHRYDEDEITEHMIYINDADKDSTCKVFERNTNNNAYNNILYESFKYCKTANLYDSRLSDLPEFNNL